MEQGEATSPSSQELRDYFRDNFDRWTEFYKECTVGAAIYQERHATAIHNAQQLRLRGAHSVLDAGCGPGFGSVALAQSGYVVHGLDFLPEMASATREFAQHSGVADRVLPTIGDILRLPFANEVFDVVVMLGVTEWVPPLDALLREAARVIKPGGHLIVAWNNRWGLQFLLDPMAHPLLGPLRRSLRVWLERWGRRTQPRGYGYTCKDFEKAFRNCDLISTTTRGIGFGPFTFFGCPLPMQIGAALNLRLQAIADHQMPWLQYVARNCVAVASKRAVDRR